MSETLVDDKFLFVLALFAIIGLATTATIAVCAIGTSFNHYIDSRIAKSHNVQYCGGFADNGTFYLYSSCEGGAYKL